MMLKCACHFKKRLYLFQMLRQKGAIKAFFFLNIFLNMVEKELNKELNIELNKK